MLGVKDLSSITFFLDFFSSVLLYKLMNNAGALCTQKDFIIASVICSEKKKKPCSVKRIKKIKKGKESPQALCSACHASLVSK